MDYNILGLLYLYIFSGSRNQYTTTPFRDYKRCLNLQARCFFVIFGCCCETIRFCKNWFSTSTHLALSLLLLGLSYKKIELCTSRIVSQSADIIKEFFCPGGLILNFIQLIKGRYTYFGLICTILCYFTLQALLCSTNK